MREAVEAAGARLLYLPPYSPEFNPIGRAFAKRKSILHSAAALAVSDFWAAIHKAFARFSPEGCRADLTAAGCEDDACVFSRSGPALGRQLTVSFFRTYSERSCPIVSTILVKCRMTSSAVFSGRSTRLTACDMQSSHC